MKRGKHLGGILAILVGAPLLLACAGGGPEPTKVVPPKPEKAAAPQPTAAAQPAAKPAATAAPAAGYPTKPVNLIVAYGAGGGTDITARLLAGHLEKELKQPVTVTNVTGGGGWTGWGQIAASPPDGYTMGYINVPNMFAGYLDPKVKRPESLSSFVPITNHVTDPGIWAVKADSRFKSVKEVVDYLKAKPDDLTIAAHGAGGDDDLAIKLISKQTGMKVKEIHNDSTAKSITQLLGGHVDLMGANVSEVVSQYKNKELRILGVMGSKRSEFLPDVPTFKEQGFDMTMSVSRGIAMPAKTPTEIAKIMGDALQRAMKNPEHVSKAREFSLALDIITGEEYIKFLKGEEQKNKELMGW